MPCSIDACSTVLPFSTVTCRPSIVRVTPFSISLGSYQLMEAAGLRGVLRVLLVLQVLRVRGCGFGVWVPGSGSRRPESKSRRALRVPPFLAATDGSSGLSADGGARA